MISPTVILLAGFASMYPPPLPFFERTRPAPRSSFKMASRNFFEIVFSSATALMSSGLPGSTPARCTIAFSPYFPFIVSTRVNLRDEHRQHPRRGSRRCAPCPPGGRSPTSRVVALACRRGERGRPHAPSRPMAPRCRRTARVSSGTPGAVHAIACRPRSVGAPQGHAVPKGGSGGPVNTLPISLRERAQHGPVGQPATRGLVSYEIVEAFLGGGRPIRAFGPDRLDRRQSR